MNEEKRNKQTKQLNFQFTHFFNFFNEFRIIFDLKVNDKNKWYANEWNELFLKEKYSPDLFFFLSICNDGYKNYLFLS